MLEELGNKPFLDDKLMAWKTNVIIINHPNYNNLSLLI